MNIFPSNKIFKSFSDVSSENKRAVMFYIHGGGFVEGSGNDDFYGPDFFLNEDVVLVIEERELN